MFLQVRWSNQQCQSTEGGWLVTQIALNLTRLISPCYNNTTCMHIQDNDTQRNLSTVSEPSRLNNIIKFNREESGRRHIRSCTTNATIVMRTRTQFGKRAFSVCSPSIWNQIPPHMHVHEPSFCPGFSQSSRDLSAFWCRNSRHCNALSVSLL